MAGPPGGGPGDSGELVGLRGPSGPRLVRDRPRGLRSALIASLSTVVFFTAIGWIVVNSPGWSAVQISFFNGKVFAESWPLIVRAFWVNVQLFIVAELLILPFGLVIAVLRSLPGPVFFRCGSWRRPTSTSSGPCPGSW